MATGPSNTPPRIQPDSLRRGSRARFMTRDGRPVDFGAYWRRGAGGRGLIVGVIAGDDRPTVWGGDGYLLDQTTPSASDLFDSANVIVWGRWRRAAQPGQALVLEVLAVPEGGAPAWSASPPTPWVSPDESSSVLLGQFTQADWSGVE